MSDWQVIPGTTDYFVSKDGRVRRRDRNLMPYSTKGYKMIGISYANGERKHRLVHRLVMAAFVGPCPDGSEVCHVNGVRGDNRLSNLRYDTRKANMRDQYLHGTRVRGERVWSAKLTGDNVREIVERARRGESGRKIAADYGCSHTAVQNVLKANVS